MIAYSTDIENSHLLASAEEIIAQARQVKTPPPDLTISEWADENRILSGDNNAEPGQWRTSRNPLLREIADCISEPFVRETSFMKPAQIGGTESLVNNPVGYFIDQDPSPMLAIFENEAKEEAWSRERFMPMVMATPCLRTKLDVEHGPSTNNKVDYKKFAGGQLNTGNSGSAGDLSSRPVRIIFKDELDKWKMLKSGDPDGLADNRTSTFLTRAKIVNLSTPLEHDPEAGVTSRIYTKYLQSDQRKPYLPCPFCGHLQNFRHDQVKYTRSSSTSEIVNDVWLECENPKCAIKQIRQMHLPSMRSRGKWIASQPFNGHAGFGYYLPFLSPWVTLKKYAEAWIQKSRQKHTKKEFVNEWMGLPWTPDMEVDSKEVTSPYLKRCEHYTRVPLGAYHRLFAFADVQKDRIEVDVWGFGPLGERWGMEHKIFWGETSLLYGGNLSQVWEELEKYRFKTWEHESGEKCHIARLFVDMGYLQSVVLKFCRGKRPQVWPAKGMSDVTSRAPLVTLRPREDKANKCKYFPIGPNEGKERVLGNALKDPPAYVTQARDLRVAGMTAEAELIEQGVHDPAPGYMHFNQNYDEEYFKQLLTSERPEWKGKLRVYVEARPGVRNEALDMCVGALAAFESSGENPAPYVAAFKKAWERRHKEETKAEEREPAEEQQETPPKQRQKPRSNWVHGWKNRR
jgi:phage terminase large subunit GpA-like protein